MCIHIICEHIICEIVSVISRGAGKGYSDCNKTQLFVVRSWLRKNIDRKIVFEKLKIPKMYRVYIIRKSTQGVTKHVEPHKNSEKRVYKHVLYSSSFMKMHWKHWNTEAQIRRGFSRNSKNAIYNRTCTCLPRNAKWPFLASSVIAIKQHKVNGENSLCLVNEDRYVYRNLVDCF